MTTNYIQYANFISISHPASNPDYFGLVGKKGASLTPEEVVRELPNSYIFSYIRNPEIQTNAYITTLQGIKDFYINEKYGETSLLNTYSQADYDQWDYVKNGLLIDNLCARTAPLDSIIAGGVPIATR
jgi:hypothetical protein